MNEKIVIPHSMRETDTMRNPSQDKQQASKESYPLSLNFHQNNLLGSQGGRGGKCINYE
jgi:hypothetical protein